MLVVTLGDPFSVNVELLAPLLAERQGRIASARGPAASHATVLVGAREQWETQASHLGAPELELTPVGALGHVPTGQGGLYFLDVGAGLPQRSAESWAEAERGAAAVRALATLDGFAPHGALAVVTAPIDKHAASLAGFAHPGQTEFFEAIWRTPGVMVLAGDRLRVGLATNHVRLADVASTLSVELVARKAATLAHTLTSSFGVATPRIAVLGVNPHAGDGGLFGDEETRLVLPALEKARAAAPHAELTGPLPADTAFHFALQGAYDGLLAMYHDQGLGPFKTVHFDDGINLTGGLPHLRVSPDHGPAQSLFLAGRAAPSSMAAALAAAWTYLERAATPRGGKESA
jgi:4-hydroxythreonine-4-phosphate dehydrogenase